MLRSNTDSHKKYYKCKKVIILFKDCISFIDNTIIKLKKTAKIYKTLVKRSHLEIKNHKIINNIRKIKKLANEHWKSACAILKLKNNCYDVRSECLKLYKQWRTIEDLNWYITYSIKKIEEYYQCLYMANNVVNGYDVSSTELLIMILELEEIKFIESAGPFKLPEIRNTILDICSEIDKGSIGQLAQLNHFWNKFVTCQSKYKDIIDLKIEMDQIDSEYCSESDSEKIFQIDDNFVIGYDSDFM